MQVLCKFSELQVWSCENKKGTSSKVQCTVYFVVIYKLYKQFTIYSIFSLGPGGPITQKVPILEIYFQASYVVMPKKVNNVTIHPLI